jgi:hypothetical protein
MSTAAIVSIYTPEGFVVAADGFDYDWDIDAVTSDAVQKIFPVRHPNIELAYSFTGTDRIQANGKEEIAFDFIEAAMVATAHLPHMPSDGLVEYSAALLRSLWPLPDSARRALDTFETPRQETTIFIDGYYAGEARRSSLTIPHDGSRADFSTGPASIGMPVGAYSIKIRDAISDASSPIARYRTKLSDIETIGDAMTSAWKLLGASMDPRAGEIESRCKAVGGWTHMATITSRLGFRWIKEPLYLTHSQATPVTPTRDR